MEQLNQTIKCILLKNDVVLISQIIEVGSELGEPDCKLVNPYQYNGNGAIVRWNSHLTNQREFMIHSDSILTILEPTEEILKSYFELVS
jgi:hypothetical protein